MALRTGAGDGAADGDLRCDWLWGLVMRLGMDDLEMGLRMGVADGAVGKIMKHLWKL